MSSYKVPQDVEAEDKLLGPFSFRQFIYLIVVAIAGLLAWGLSQIFIGLVVIPIPIMVFFLILALPLKKDQPMETYLTAVVRFWLKPRVRLWDPEGAVMNVEITAPKNNDVNLTKDFSGSEASKRLAYLAQIVDTGGWASRGVTSATSNVNLSDTLVAEAQSAEDMLDNTANVSQNLESMITKTDAANKQAMLAAMRATIDQSQQAPSSSQQPVISPAPVATPTIPAQQPVQQITTPQTTQDDPVIAINYNPYPSAIHQKVIAPQDATPTTPRAAQPQPPVIHEEEKPQASSSEAISPDILRLATSKDLSISTIAREAQRLKDREEGEEVVISLR